ncbi:LVIVD repeat-containing protein [Kordia sp.]|uniref:LVIVD repeat-containing protein n=1 Tax=Kordia sp. TaxID=1965332 RepID=UPI003B5A9F9B
MKLNYFFLFIATCLFVSCSDDKEYENYNVATPITMSKAELRASIQVLPPQSIVTSGKIYAYQQYIFVNDVDKGVHIIDNRNPLQPTIINFLKIPLNRDVSIKGNYLYADSGEDLVVFDISQINNIHRVGFVEDVIQNYQYFQIPNDVDFYNWEDFDANTDIIVGWDIAVERREVMKDDIVNLESSSGGGGTGAGGSLARFKIVNDHLYVVDNSRINVFDIQNLDAPVKVGEEYVTWEAETIFHENNKLFIGSTTGMFIYDISQPSSPQYISEFDHMRFCDPVVVDGDYAYVTLRAGASCSMEGETQMLDSRLEIIDISDIYNPQLVETYIMDEPYGLGVKDDRLFICDGSAGLKVYNKSDISNLQLLQNYNTNDAYDVIPMVDKLLMIGNNTLTQYNYTATGIELISEFTIQ